MQQFERGQYITYTDSGNTYKGRIQDVAETMLGVIRDHSGNYDAVMKSDVIIVPADPRSFQIGDRVRMIAEDPAHGAGEVEVGDIGVIVQLENSRGVDCVVDFPRQGGWNADFADLEHEHVQVAAETEVSLDEAVANWQNVNQQIKELEAQAANYIRVMRRAGIKPV
ncbi:hypothetical protein REC_162 [Pseudomonas phage REC]|nr:hypothetical protein REC_162 [Pseudomonas phage REC]UGL62566.1 hypothetical protein [Pseudomonas phage REC1]